MEEIRSCWLIPVSTLTAVFWIIWRFSRELLGNADNNELHGLPSDRDGCSENSLNDSQLPRFYGPNVVWGLSCNGCENFNNPLNCTSLIQWQWCFFIAVGQLGNGGISFSAVEQRDNDQRIYRP